ncbi:MAG: energy-coupling factor transporter transmembrane component T [Spirochaetia bacterium]|jgi:energy-coupling factor transport system permease protein|nr:energy-coupling factor transporter transmembrane component T [Spirochaetia bacterium]
MKGLEFWKNVSIGRYIESDSPVHRLTPVAKYLWLLAIMMASSLSSSIAVVCVSAMLPLLFAMLARVRIGFLLRGFLPVLPFIGLAAVFQILFTWPGDETRLLLSVGTVSLSLREAIAVAMMGLRFIAIMLGVGLFTSVTSEGETARGIEDLFSPLTKVGFPARAFALTIAIAFKFIPILAGEFESLVKAQASRGADFGAHSRNPIRKARAYLPLIVPVTIRALERAESLAEAMEARCYGTGKATRYVEAAGGTLDTMVRIGAGLYMASALVYPHAVFLAKKAGLL